MSDSPTPTPLKPVDESLQKEAFSYAKWKTSHGTELEKQAFSNIANVIPSTRAVFPGFAVGYKQGGFINEQLFPTIVAAPEGTEIASFPVFGTEAFYNAEDDTVAINAGRKSADYAMTWQTAQLEAHAMDAPVDIRLSNALAVSGIDAAAGALEVARGQVEAHKEKALATLLRTTGTYSTAATLFNACTSTECFGNAGSTPIEFVNDAAETVRSVCGVRPNTFWLSPKAFMYLSTNAEVIGLLKYQGNLGAPATAEALASLFRMNIVIGDSLSTSTPTGVLSDTWGHDAGLLVVGDTNMHSQKFGATFTMAGSPKVMPPYLDRRFGAEGSMIYSYVDYYKHKVTMSTAGYLWTDIGATG